MNYDVFDLFGYLHGGMNTPIVKNLKYKGMPIGGLNFFLRNLCLAFKMNSKVAVASDWTGPRGAVSKLDGYKSNRHRDPGLLAQAVLVKQICNDCGIPFFDGYGEADDHLFGLTNFIKNQNDFHAGSILTIHSDDHDIYHNVDQQVVVKAITSRSDTVTSSNFNAAVRDKDTSKVIRMGSISAHKALRYDKSDSVKTFIPTGVINEKTFSILLHLASKNRDVSVDSLFASIARPVRPIADFCRSVKGTELYGVFTIFLDAGKYWGPSLLRNKQVFLKFVDMIFTEQQDIEQLKLRADVFYPSDLSSKVIGGYSAKSLTEIDSQKFMDYLVALNTKDLFLGARGIQKAGLNVLHQRETLEWFNHKLTTFSLDFTKGKFHADRGTPLIEPRVFGASINVLRDLD